MSLGSLALLVALGPLAMAVDVRLSWPEGAPRAGEEVPVDVVVLDGLRPEPGVVPQMVAEQGVLLTEGPGELPGRTRVRYRAPAQDSDQISVTVGAETVQLPVRVAPADAPVVALPRVARGMTGRPVRIPLDLPATQAAALLAGAPEGDARIEVDGDAVALVWAPGPDPFARAVPLSIWRPGAIDRTPAFVVVRLSGRPRIPIRVSEPGTRATIEVGGRRYGPFTVGDDGVIAASAEVRPGEGVAQVVLEDSAGNVRRSEVALGGDRRPALTVVPRPTGPQSSRGAVVELLAVDARGRPWRGASPQCRTSVGQVAPVTPLGDGRWRAAVPPPPPGAFFDVRVDCTLAELAVASTRLPVGSPRPAQLRLESFPAELPAESPQAQVQAFLESVKGERLPATGITLRAERGRLEPLDTPDNAAARAAYDGQDAVAAGEDTLTATWTPPLSSAAVRGVELVGGWRDGVHLAARAWGEGGPTRGGAIELALGDRVQEVLPDEDGWARLTLPAPDGRPATLRATVAGVERRLLLLPGEQVGRPAGAPDLEASLRLPIRSGRVRSVLLDLEPRTVEAVPGETARVVIRLLDQDGNPVADEGVDLTATMGVVTRPRRRGDGSYEATWAPPPTMPFGDVRITATSATGAFADTSTDLEVVPRVVRRAPGVAVGWLFGRAGLSSPYVSATGDLQLGGLGERVYVRAAVGFYGQRIDAVDDVTAQPIALDLDLLPLEVGLLAREQRGRVAGWLGGSGLAVPYFLDARFGGSVATRGLNLAPPGLSAFSGGSWRFRGGELSLEVAYKFVTLSAPDVGWEGNVGGLVVTGGYRVLF